MSYDIALYRIETKEKEEATNDANFFDAKENLVPFTPQQYEELKVRLIDYDYECTTED